MTERDALRVAAQTAADAVDATLMLNSRTATANLGFVVILFPFREGTTDFVIETNAEPASAHRMFTAIAETFGGAEILEYERPSDRIIADVTLKEQSGE